MVRKGKREFVAHVQCSSDLLMFAQLMGILEVSGLSIVDTFVAD
jgi:hypothetical protein